MAKRKGVSKARNFGTRKQISEPSNSPKEGIRLKNDPGGTHDMDEPKLISSKKVASNSEEYRLNSKSYVVDSLSHRKNSSDAKSDEDSVNTIRSDSANSTDLINSNNNNSKPLSNSSNDHKYLHKKFKRIASATLDEVQQVNHRQSAEVIGGNARINNSNRQEDSSKSVKYSEAYLKGGNKDRSPYATLNGHAENSIRAYSAKSVFLTPELNGEVNDFHKGSSNFRANLQNVNIPKYSPNHEDSTQSSSSFKVDHRASPLINASVNNNNFLNRVPLITSSFNSSSSPVPTATVLNVSNHQKTPQQSPSSQRSQQREVADQSFSGRHVCPYCNLNCTKPSVLQKHIRAHTNERPYPCDTCGFAFKTKSNYYKHCRSRSHALRTKGVEAQPDEDGSLGSDQDQDPDLSNSSSDVISRTASPMDERTSSPAVQQQAAHSIQKYSNEKPYKPKFHNAALYAKEEISPHQKQQHQQQQQHQQHNNYNHQSQTVSNYYQPSSYHQQIQPQEQESSVHYQQQQQQQPQQQQQQHHSKNRLEQAPQPPLPPSQNFQQVASGYNESTQPSSSIRESTSSSSFSGITAASGGGHQLNREFLQEHISKIISQNEAIVENKELLLQKKYPKLSGKSKSNSTLVLANENSNSKLAFALASKQQQHLTHRDEVPNCKSNVMTNPLTSTSDLSHNPAILFIPRVSQQVGNQVEMSTSQPLNLSKICEQIDNARKRASVDSLSTASSENIAPTPVKSGPSRPQTQERSIIKHLLLNARGLGVPNGEGDDAVYTCPLCQMEFRSAEDLRLHTSNYCQGGPSSAPISPVASPSHKYFRSNSINVNLPEFNNPTSLAKLARSSLLHLSRNPLSLAKLAWSQLKTKPSNLVLNQLNVNTNTTAASSSSQNDSVTIPSRAIDTPLPSPGPLLGKTPLVEAYNNSDRRSEDVVITKVHEENRNFPKEFSPKRLRLNNYPHQQQQFHAMVNDARTSAGNRSIPVYACGQVTFELAHNRPLQQSQPSFPMCGGEVQMLDKKEDRMKRFLSSGGCIIPISECPDIESSPKMIRTPLLSGGSFTEVSPKTSGKDTPATPSTTPKMMIPIAPLTPSLPTPNLLSAGLPLTQHFQFPPINSITAFNPLTLPPVSIVPSSVMHGDKMIPFVPGIPGPNTLAMSTLPHPPPPQLASEILLSRNASPSRKKTPSPSVSHSIAAQHGGETGTQHVGHTASPRHQVMKPIIRVESESPGVENIRLPQRSPRHWTQPSTTAETSKKSFNFTRMADNLSPRKNNVERNIKSPEVRHFNFENIPKMDIAVPPPQQQQQQQQSLMPLHVDVSSTVTTTTAPKVPSESEISEAKSKAKSKFLRPTSLPLKPGTFTPKRHHGITPTANTLPLISPETPRPSKACVQLYLNGHAYTYLGLKCSTKMFYCTVNCPQPSYVANLHKLSMYSVWQVCAENNPHPLGLKPKTAMSLYDSRQRASGYTTAAIQLPFTTVHSQSTVMTPFENNFSTSGQFYHHQMKTIQSTADASGKNEGKAPGGSVLVGGYESNEDYTYIRGRGRGRYVCSECGIRCKKPSMLKKHIRTHTDVRPYTCQHCSFSFKTKGNLTKHMQSKTHYKKCLELGINPGPMPAEGEFMDTDGDTDQQSTISGGGRTSSIQDESDSDDYSDIGDGETESSDTDESKSRLPEHEAARCLLSLSMTPPANNSSSQAIHGRSQYPHYKQGDGSQITGRSGDDGPNSIQPYSPRRVISFTSPKPPFDYQKQEQYYSNPSIPKSRDDKFDEANMKPIDLTKPRQSERSRISEVIGELASESGFLKSLVSITDRIRGTTCEPVVQAQKVDESILFQAYLTEQALKYTKIKQSQMSRNFSEITSSTVIVNTTATVASSLVCAFDRRPEGVPRIPESNSFTTLSSSSSSRPISSVTEQVNITAEGGLSQEVPEFEESIASEQRLSPSIRQTGSSKQSDNETKSLGLSGSGSQTKETVKEISSSPRPRSLPSGTGGAKSVASEYLKMTSAEYLKSRNTRNEESEESSSDQEINVTETPATSLKPSSDFGGVLARTVIVGEDGFKSSSNEVQPMFPRVPLSDDGRPVCTICSKSFQKQHQMVLHMNIHYMERKFKCEPCAVSFRTQGHLQKHERSEAHKNKVMMTSTFGVPTTSNPRPFECSDCKVAFRIHGHLAKHLRSKTHVQKLECLQKLPFGTYAEIERAGISLTEIDTTDCDNSLASLKALAQKLIEKDPNKLNSYTVPPSCMETNSRGAASQESGGEDSPDHRHPEANELTEMTSVSSSAIMPSSEGSGVKRKHDSFSSSCSNDSTAMNAAATQQHDIGLEKRPRTTSET